MRSLRDKNSEIFISLWYLFITILFINNLSTTLAQITLKIRIQGVKIHKKHLGKFVDFNLWILINSMVVSET